MSVLSYMRQCVAVMSMLICAGDVFASPADSLPADTLSMSRNADGKWYRQLIDNRGKINDPDIKYPRFIRFLVDAYEWGDRVFNSYDSTYVVGTGKNWKVMAKNYMWMEGYMLIFSPHIRDMIHLRSNLYDDVGAHISFMAVSIGYTAKLNSIFGGGSQSSRDNLNFSFTSSRIYGNLDYTSTEGGARITHFGDFSDDNKFSYPFNDIKNKTIGAQLYYFLNHKKYSQAAAYCFSKYQMKSAGSPIVGVAISHQRIDMDFSQLPADMKAVVPSLDDTYRFRYTDYCVVGGYGYNFAIRPKKWLINLTGLGALGYRHSYKDSTHGDKNIVATNLLGRFSVVYNRRALFAGMLGNFNASFYFDRNYSFFNAIFSWSFIVGARF